MIARMRKRVYNPPDMTPETEEAPQGMGEVSRIAGVFFEPKKTFEDIARRPTFLVPLALVILFGLAFGMAVSQRIGARQLAQQQIEKNPRYDQMTPEQRQNGVELGAKISSVLLYVGPIIAAPLATLVIAGVLLGIVAGIMSAPVRFKQVFAVVAWAGLPRIIFSVLAITVLFMKNPTDFNIQNPLAFNPGAFMDPPKGVAYTIASAFDLFTLWGIFLMATGLKAAAGKKLSFGGALFSVVLPWLVVVMIQAAFAGFFS